MAACAGGAETCEDIEGANESSYKLGTEDTGSRIRVVVSASSEEGEGGSTLTAPILPAENTVWTLEGELSVKEVLEAAQESEAPIVAIEYGDAETFGAYSGGIAGTEAEDVLEAIDEAADPENADSERASRSRATSPKEGKKNSSAFFGTHSRPYSKH